MTSSPSQDSTRSWVVAFGCCWINFFSALMYKSSGVVYVGVLQALDVSREEASWPLTLLTVFIFATGPVAGVLALYLDIWKISLCGCLLSSLAVCACFYADSIVYLMVCLGVIQGFGLGLLTLHNVIINQHFEKHRATASGISYAGPTLASLVYPPVIQVLFDEFGLRGSLLLFGGIMLNAVAGAFLQRPPPSEAVKKSSYKVVPEESTKGDAESTVPLARGVWAEYKKETQLDDQMKSPLGLPGCEDPTVPTKDLAEDEDVRFHGLDAEECSRLRRNLSVFLVPMFYLICASFALILFNLTTYLTVIVDFAVGHGVSRISAVLLISVYSVADLAARLGSGWISDRGFVSRGNMMAVHFLMGGLVLFAIPVFTTYVGQAVMAVVSGWANGCTMILVSVLLTEHTGLDRLPVSFGVTSLIAGALCLTRPPLIGYYRDTSGDYEGLFHLVGGVSLVFSAIWSLATLVLKLRSRRK
ncbi:unnamed protein product [Ixodes hexagonus]